MNQMEYRIPAEQIASAIDLCGAEKNELGKLFFPEVQAKAENLPEQAKELFQVMAKPDVAIGVTIKAFEHELLINGSLFADASSAVYVTEVSQEALLTGMDLEGAKTGLKDLFPVSGVLSESGGAFRIGENGLLCLLALADHFRRSRMEALLAGESVKQEIEDVREAVLEPLKKAFEGGDMRWLTPFFKASFGTLQKPDPERGIQELMAPGIVEDNGALTSDGLRLVRSLSYADAMESLAALSKAEEGFYTDHICFIRSATQMWQIVQTEEFCVLSACSAQDQNQIVERLFEV
ncbi:MAG: hypothetical protein K6A92_11535 [Lachnospiraceae bacterium]|nr:hypothetical protein [Lachnospiraceae bacterium]